MSHTETHAFQTEVNQLLKLMIHALYSNKEIFLRELVSNASDALDKLRFESVSNDALSEGESELAIQVGFDKEARTVSIIDNGIGMTRDEVIANIGTIANSGTKTRVSKPDMVLSPSISPTQSNSSKASRVSKSTVPTSLIPALRASHAICVGEYPSPLKE